MKKILFAFALLGASCSSSHFISEHAERAAVQGDFNARLQQLPRSGISEVAADKGDKTVAEALQFLYAYMPLADVADYPVAFHRAGVETALRTRNEMPWGKLVPDREFRHFVLPMRVNNEHLDSFRTMYYEELKARVQSLNMEQAVLEVNHWCHEHVTYTPSDARTSSPVASIRTAYGRCGEESTLLVSALRTVGIPARQVYTPRWAHTDDNHAWVEAWVDGKWHFLGACEPEAVLDLGWFNAPAARGLLMHTKVFGRYAGPEEVISTTPNYTEINVVGNYADTARAVVTVVDGNGNPVPDARVDFRIYNYAEFYPAVSKRTADDGTAALTAGKGDMLVWASKDGRFGYGKLSFGKQDALRIVLAYDGTYTASAPIDIVPPVEKRADVAVSEELQAINQRRLATEDSIRRAYVSTFPDAPRRAAILAEAGVLQPEADGLLTASRGNYAAIAAFLRATSPALKERAVALLGVISEKDLRDTPAEVLADHLRHTPEVSTPLFDRYILNPRVTTELLTPYKSFFRKVLPESLANDFRRHPDHFVRWCTDSLALRDDINRMGVPVSPEGVWNTRCTDAPSRNVFFVSVLRTLGVPARVDVVTGKLQYAADGLTWTDVSFDAAAEAQPQGYVTASYTPTAMLDNPQYYSHFTLSHFEDGTYSLLNFPEGESGSWAQLLRQPMSLDAGGYLLTTGTRLASGGVLGNTTFFTVTPGDTTRLELTMRDDPEEVKVIGNLNSEALFRMADKAEPQSLLSVTGRGYYVVALLGEGQEPTNHALRDLAAVRADLEKWGRKLVLLFPDDEQLRKFRVADFPALPENVVWGVDQTGSIGHEMVQNLKVPETNALPVFVIADTFNRVVFVSHGYTIGLGEQLMKIIRKL